MSLGTNARPSEKVNIQLTMRYDFSCANTAAVLIGIAVMRPMKFDSFCVDVSSRN
jgi:hypothetical protein